MASFNGFVLGLFVAFAFSSFNVGLAARHLLQLPTLPPMPSTIPSLPKPTLPTLPPMPTAIPSLPKPSLPTLPPMPTLPTLPKTTLPPLPSMPSVPLPTMPAIPTIPSVTPPPGN
ncbi:Protein PELPK1 [Linum grandiflorum]